MGRGGAGCGTITWMRPGLPVAWDETAHLRRVFRLLVLYRWLSLAPPLVFLLGGAITPVAAAALAAAILSNLLISLTPDRLNQVLQRAPALLGVDLLFSAGLLALTGGWRSPYHLFTLSPILAAAFFFGARGALLSAGAFAPLSGLAMAGAVALGGPPPDGLALALAFASYFLVAGMVGYAADLLARARGAHGDLARAHRELEIIHDLTISLQNAPDVSDVQDRVLEAVTRDLGFRRAIVGLMDQPYMVLTFWRESAPAAGDDDRPSIFAARLPVEPGGGFLAGAILSNRLRTLPAGASLTGDPAFDRALDLRGEAFVAPMTLREHPVGVLLVETDRAAGGPATPDMKSLQAIAAQAAVALGTTMLCIDRAQRLAVQEERMRFAREMHDTISQSLFGIAFSLDGLGKLLPAQPDRVKAELEQVRQAAEQTRAEIRQSILDIWPSALTADVFANDLRRFVSQMCRPGELQLEVCVEGDFAALSPRRQRGLYRVAQEALTNVVKHASAGHAAVRLEVNGGQAVLRVDDDGRGFDPAQALARERDREHFGLKGMRERIEALSGVCKFFSQTGHGSTVIATVPLLPQAAEADE